MKTELINESNKIVELSETLYLEKIMEQAKIKSKNTQEIILDIRRTFGKKLRKAMNNIKSMEKLLPKLLDYIRKNYPSENADDIVQNISFGLMTISDFDDNDY